MTSKKQLKQTREGLSPYLVGFKTILSAKASELAKRISTGFSPKRLVSNLKISDKQDAVGLVTKQSSIPVRKLEGDELQNFKSKYVDVVKSASFINEATEGNPLGGYNPIAPLKPKEALPTAWIAVHSLPSASTSISTTPSSSQNCRECNGALVIGFTSNKLYQGFKLKSPNWDCIWTQGGSTFNHPCISLNHLGVETPSGWISDYHNEPPDARGECLGLYVQGGPFQTPNPTTNNYSSFGSSSYPFTGFPHNVGVEHIITVGKGNSVNAPTTSAFVDTTGVTHNLQTQGLHGAAGTHVQYSKICEGEYTLELYDAHPNTSYIGTGLVPPFNANYISGTWHWGNLVEEIKIKLFLDDNNNILNR